MCFCRTFSDLTKLFDLTEETFDEIALLVNPMGEGNIGSLRGCPKKS
jgi:hypothetical protein